MFIGKKTIVSITVIIAAVFLRNFKNLNKRRAPVVEISTGKLQGIISSSRDGRDFYEYLNIPYSKSPVNELRFEPPEPAERWDDNIIRDASEYGPKCIQIDLFSTIVEGVEDCLQLNVHTPKMNHDGSMKTLLPVMVWIHGGLFIFGSGTLYKADYFMEKLQSNDEEQDGVVVVTINYRLGSFGFLNTAEGTIRGNMGLKDQTMALKWVQENIVHFGGDPNKVTIFGESAGGASVHYHLFSKMSNGLFHKAISQSGMATNPWALYKYPGEQASRFAEKLNCSFPQVIDRVHCMKNLSADQVINVHLETVNPLRELISVFVPTLEVDIPDGKTFITQSPKILMESGNFTKVPFLTGVDSHEGLINAAVIFRNESLVNLLRSNWNEWIPRLLYLSDDVDRDVLQKLKNFYVSGEISATPESLAEFDNITNMFTDRFWNMEFHNGVQAQITHSTSPVYLYYYSYNGEFTLTDILLALKGNFHPIIEVVSMKIKNWFTENILQLNLPRYGVCHGDEIAMQFYVPLPLMPQVLQDHADYKFSKEIVKLWTSFARSPSNQSTLEFMGQTWPSQEPSKPLQYMQLDATPKLIFSPFLNRIEFWNSLNLS